MTERRLILSDMAVAPMVLWFGGQTPAVAGFVALVVVSFVLDYYYRTGRA